MTPEPYPVHGAGLGLRRSFLVALYARFGIIPTLLERDFNIPPLGELVREVEPIKQIQRVHAARSARSAADA